MYIYLRVPKHVLIQNDSILVVCTANYLITSTIIFSINLFNFINHTSSNGKDSDIMQYVLQTPRGKELFEVFQSR